MPIQNKIHILQLMQEGQQQAQASMMQAWFGIKTACEQLPDSDKGKSAACERIARAERALIEVMQHAEDVLVSHLLTCYVFCDCCTLTACTCQMDSC